jgi:hypothetical protein
VTHTWSPVIRSTPSPSDWPSPHQSRRTHLGGSDRLPSIDRNRQASRARGPRRSGTVDAPIAQPEHHGLGIQVLTVSVVKCFGPSDLRELWPQGDAGSAAWPLAVCVAGIGLLLDEMLVGGFGGSYPRH